MAKLFIIVSLFLTPFFSVAQLSTVKKQITNFQGTFPLCIANTLKNKLVLKELSIPIKYENQHFIYFSSNQKEYEKLKQRFVHPYIEYNPPALLSDTARAFHFVNEVHNGSGGLNSSYTGQGVIIGFVDTGIDYNHPDFQDANGNTRIIRYWDQSMPDNANSPQPYGYGYIWDSTDINNGTITSIDGGGHGTTVAGQATGNGMANGQNKGMAPDATIIIVQSDFSRPNWTMTVADAVDYIFKVADSLGMPAVVNLSVGSYLGSHDGNDPASEMIESLLDAKYGRIVVCAAGNSGNIGKYHVRHTVTSDTNFVWFQNNPGGAFGNNTIFFDLWSDASDATFYYAFGANQTGPNWSDRGRTVFRLATDNLNTTIYDTIYNNNGDKIANVEIYTEIVNGNFNLQLLAYIDSTSYNYRFDVTGSGMFDLWSGAGLGLNTIVETVPPPSEFPNGYLMILPDNEQSIVSSWNCSEKVISVANMHNRYAYIDLNNNIQVNPSGLPPGALSVNSSKGPNRHGLIKPDLTASGDFSLCAAPLSFLSNPANSDKVQLGGWHARNGGTSMASPVVAGIAALYLERCNRAKYSDFIADAQNTAYTDTYTGITPNNAYGYGKIHALNTLLQQVIPNAPILSSDWSNYVFSSESTGNEWYLNNILLPNETNDTLVISPPYGTYQVYYTNTDGCSVWSSPLTITASIDENYLSEMTLYPNPATQLFKIKIDQDIKSLKIMDLSGQQISSVERIEENTYDISSLSSGVYFVEINTMKKKYRIKLIKTE